MMTFPKYSFTRMCFVLLTCFFSDGVLFKIDNIKNNERTVGLQQLGQDAIRITSVLTTCTCVPPGNCISPTLGPSDEIGQIDIRIVNNPYQTIINQHICNYGLIQCCLPGSYRCGRRFSPPPTSVFNIPGQAAFGSFPWQAALLTIGNVYLGSGALIDERHILTVAHKILNLPISSFKVRLGEWDASSIIEPIPAEDISVGAVFIHQLFNKINLQNDIAIIRLSRTVNLSQKSSIGAICLPTVPFVEQRCFVAGWGKNDFGPTGNYQAIQREVDVPLVSNSNCQTILRNTKLGQNFVLNGASFICAGGEIGKDACTGDGGSPLACQNNARWFVVGLVVWGVGCGTSGIPGVYVNVATYLSWIQATLIRS